MQLHDLQPKTKNQSSKRIGRGGKRGKTSGRGTKGQKARAGHSIRPAIRDIIKKLPKLRGYGINRARTVNDSVVSSAVVNISSLEEIFNTGDKVTPETLKSKGLISIKKGDKKKTIKILGTGELSKKLLLSGCAVSKSAKEQIEKVGGSILEN